MNIALLKSMFFQGYWPIRASRLGLASHVRPPTSDDHNFFVRTPFLVFLDSMKRELSQGSRNCPEEDSRQAYIFINICFFRASGGLGLAG